MFFLGTCTFFVLSGEVSSSLVTLYNEVHYPIHLKTVQIIEHNIPCNEFKLFFVPANIFSLALVYSLKEKYRIITDFYGYV